MNVPFKATDGAIAFQRERNKVLETLRHGALLERVYGHELHEGRIIWRLIVEALQTISRMRDREMGWLKSAERSHMPEVIRRWREVYEVEVSRLQDGMSQFDSAPTRMGEPTTEECERMIMVLDWFRFIQSRDPRRMRDCIMAMAAGASTAQVGRIWRPGQKPNRQAVHDIKARAINHIRKGLHQDYAIAWRKGGFQIVDSAH